MSALADVRSTQPTCVPTAPYDSPSFEPLVFTVSPKVISNVKRLEDAGVILSYICPLMYMNNPLCKKKAVITCSNKLRTYTSARFYRESEILDIITSKEGK